MRVKFICREFVNKSRYVNSYVILCKNVTIFNIAYLTYFLELQLNTFLVSKKSHERNIFLCFLHSFQLKCDTTLVCQ